MNTKYSPQDFATFFAQYQSISKKKAEAFIRSFFDTIESGLMDDKFVKIKGFGTFKIITVGERESINVNTGKRIQISSHPKITFTPDTLLKDTVNKPFAQFQTVTLNEDIKDSDFAEIDSKVALEVKLAEKEIVEQPETIFQKDENLASEETTISDDLVPTEDLSILEESQVSALSEVEKPSKAEEVTSLDNSNEPQEGLSQEEIPLIELSEGVSLPPIHGSNAENNSNETASKNNAEEDGTEEQISPTKHSIRHLKIAGFILCSLALLITFYFAGYYHIFGDHMETVKVSTITPPAASTPQSSKIATLADTPQTKPANTANSNKPDTLPPAIPPAVPSTPQLRPEDKYAQMEGSNYKIIGIIGTHSLQRGENLYRLAKQTYGNRDFAKYIIFFNKIENPDVITIGSVVKLPKLEKKN